MPRDVEVAIIGAGSAGLFALSQVRKKTQSFVLIDGGELGTTCARVGCMPSKVMIQVAEDFHRKSIFKREGIEGEESLKLDVETAMEHVQDLRDLFVDKTLEVTDSLDQDHLIRGYARFVDTHTLDIDGEQVRAKTIIIATGSSPVIPAAWPLSPEDIITTDTLFELDALPKSIAVIGMGSIGIEIGQALSRMGVEVTGIDQLSKVAQLVDEVVNKAAIDTFSREFPVWLGRSAEVRKTDKGIEVTCESKTVVVEKIFASLGRKPNLDKLNLEVIPMDLDDKGIPIYNKETMQVGTLPIFIAGDVNADRALLHEAGHEGRVAGYNASHSTVTAYKRKVGLGITFSDPNIATVGAQLNELNETEIAIGETQFGPVGRALIIGKNRGVLRIYARRSDGKLLGAAMVCTKGENLAQLIALAIQQEMTVFDMLKLPFYHPTIEEALQSALYSVLSKLDIKKEVVELEKI